MKIAIAIAIALVILSSIPIPAQQAGVSAQQSASATVGSRNGVSSTVR